MKKFLLALFLLCGTCGYAQETPEEIAAEEAVTEMADQEADQDENLMFDGIDTNEEEIANCGMLGTTEGTYADSEEICVLDDETVYSNEVDVTPSWCP